jgi:hypothetical protein
VAGFMGSHQSLFGGTSRHSEEFIQSRHRAAGNPSVRHSNTPASSDGTQRRARLIAQMHRQAMEAADELLTQHHAIEESPISRDPSRPIQANVAVKDLFGRAPHPLRPTNFRHKHV